MGPWSHLWYVGKLESEPVRLHSLSAYPLPCNAPCWEDQVSEGKLSGPVSGYSSLAFPPKNSHFASASELNNRAVLICLSVALLLDLRPWQIKDVSEVLCP